VTLRSLLESLSPSAPGADYNNVQSPVDGKRRVSVNGFKYTDVKQGSIGDCGLISVMAAICKQNPKAIDNMISNEKYDKKGNLVSADDSVYQRDASGVLKKAPQQDDHPNRHGEKRRHADVRKRRLQGHRCGSRIARPGDHGVGRVRSAAAFVAVKSRACAPIRPGRLDQPTA
jgi:hypothetical protein